MQQTTVLSTLILTLLLLVGLFFFLRASVKDRTEEAELEFRLQPQQLKHHLRSYLEKRSYQLVEEADRRLVFAGIVAPSRFLALFLTLLAFLGLSCLALVVAILLPSANWLVAVLPILSPVAGLYYWNRARRPEKVVARIDGTGAGAKLVIQAHRDEILVLKSALEIANG